MATNTPIAAENVCQLFPEVEPLSASQTYSLARASASESGDFDGYDAEQVRMMDEVCIVLDADDNPIARASKRACTFTPTLISIPYAYCNLTIPIPGHLMTNITSGLLHRAFSCFLFNSQNELLLQQRADSKITFPGLWTNTCCSHPLYIPGEVGDDLAGAILGAKRAAQRKLTQELGIKSAQVPLQEIDFLTRVHYLAPSDGKWGEHESAFIKTYKTRWWLFGDSDYLVDYILFVQADVDVDANPNEVKDIRWVSSEQLRGMFEDTSLNYTPWFRLICDRLLFKWWGSLGTPGFDKYKEEREIRRML